MFFLSPYSYLAWSRLKELKGCGPWKNVNFEFGENVVLYPGSTVIGDVRIGTNCAIASGAWIKDESVPDNSLVFGRSPDLVIKKRPISYFWETPGKWKVPDHLKL